MHPAGFALERVRAARDLASVDEYVVPAGELGAEPETRQRFEHDAVLPVLVVSAFVGYEGKVEVPSVVVDRSPARMPSYELDAGAAHAFEVAFAPRVLVPSYYYGVRVHEEIERNAFERPRAVLLKKIFIHGKVEVTVAVLTDYDSVHTAIIHPLRADFKLNNRADVV